MLIEEQSHMEAEDVSSGFVRLPSFGCMKGGTNTLQTFKLLSFVMIQNMCFYKKEKIYMQHTFSSL